MTITQQEAEAAWLKAVREFERLGVEPSAYTAFCTAYRIGKAEGLTEGKTNAHTEELERRANA